MLYEKYPEARVANGGYNKKAVFLPGNPLAETY